MPSEKTLSLTIPALADYIDIARLALYGIANKMGFSYEDIEDMKVALAEACNNAVMHAYKGREEGSIDIRFEIRTGEIRITISDQGKSFDYEEVSQDLQGHHGKELEQLDAGGLGIYLMQALMDEVEVKAGDGTQVTLVKYLHPVHS